MKQVGWVRLALIVVALATLAAVMAPSASGGEHHRLVARMDQPFAVNDRLFEEGQITILQVRRYSPSATLNQIWIDGECLGVFLAEVLSGGEEPKGHSLHFDRDSEDRLVLAGFAFGGERARAFYRFRTVTSGGRWTTRTARNGHEPTPIVASR